MPLTETFGVDLIKESYYWVVIPLTIIGTMANAMIVCLWFKKPYHPIRFLLKALAFSHTLFALCYHGYVIEEDKDYFGYVTRLSRLFSVHGSLLLTVVQYFRAFHSHSSPFFSRPRIASGLVVVFLWCMVVRNLPLVLHHRVRVETTLVETLFLIIGVELPAAIQLVVALVLMYRYQRRRRMSRVEVTVPSSKRLSTVGQSVELRKGRSYPRHHSMGRPGVDGPSGITVTTAISPTNLTDVGTLSKRRSNVSLQEPSTLVVSKDSTDTNSFRQELKSKPAYSKGSSSPNTATPTSLGKPPSPGTSDLSPRISLAPPRPVRGNTTPTISKPSAKQHLGVSGQPNKQTGLGSKLKKTSPVQRNTDTVSSCSRFSQKSWGKISMSQIQKAAHVQVRVDDQNLRRAVVVLSILPAIFYTGAVVGASYFLLLFHEDDHIYPKNWIYSYYSMATMFNFSCHFFILLVLCPDFRQSFVVFLRLLCRCPDIRLSKWRPKKQTTLSVPLMKQEEGLVEETAGEGDAAMAKGLSQLTVASADVSTKSGTYWTSSEMSLPEVAEEYESPSDSSGSHSNTSCSSDDDSSSRSMAGSSVSNSTSSRFKLLSPTMNTKTPRKSRRKKSSASTYPGEPSKKIDGAVTIHEEVSTSKPTATEAVKEKTEVLPGAVPSDT